ncbi:hypothetical protein SAMN05660772_02741 [Pasteurella testudinis DSM 23072]|uniref:Uncharacterized protein n=1 Tax=Pasteurella testudinis DSM 23072 TaxID=1122938 RepID=A0A1W1V454_9PAST|nr:hypothetical protein [Pasteurella testudinis]SMB87801.1 hypothetical protein SAMN05660772_02741 [Pasteurella testudinis DSM 23072]SUB51593.1 pyruvate kinase [Pasteurella testudinis]
MSKPFDLEKALAGEPINFNGEKAYIVQSPRSSECVLVETESGETHGYSKPYICSKNDVLMWQDKPQIDENGRYLSEPIKGDDVYFPDCANRSFLVCVLDYDPEDEYDKDTIKNKPIFAKREAAEFEAIKLNIERYCPIENAKLVMYFGKVYSVPKWAKWISIDLSGSIYVHSGKPDLDNGEWLTLSDSKSKLIAECDYCDDWPDSLREV